MLTSAGLITGTRTATVPQPQASAAQSAKRRFFISISPEDWRVGQSIGSTPLAAGSTSRSPRGHHAHAPFPHPRPCELIFEDARPLCRYGCTFVHTLNKKCITSTSWTTYSLPSTRIAPLLLAAASEP